MRTTTISAILVLVVCTINLSNAAQVGSGWTYQGRLIYNSNTAEGLYDFQFKLFDDPCTGTQQASTFEVNDLDVIDGYFTVELDFGDGVFDGNSVWLEIDIRPGDSNEPNDFITLVPRQELTPAPYAMYAEGADWDNLKNIPAGFADGIDNTGSGDITSVVAGTGLNGGGYSGSVTLNIDVPLVLSGTDLNGIIVATNDDSKGKGIIGISESGGAGVYGLVTYTGTGITWGVSGESYSGAGRGVYGYASATGAYTNYGGYFESEGDTGIGVYGEAWGDQGKGVYGKASTVGMFTNYGGYFEALGSQGIGVYGYGARWAGYFDGDAFFFGDVSIGTNAGAYPLDVTGDVRLSGNIGIGTDPAFLTGEKLRVVAGSNNNYAGYFRNSGGGLDKSGLRARADGTGPQQNFGLHGSAENSSGKNYGVYGYASSTNVLSYSYGLYGEAEGPGTNWAGYFKGNVYVRDNVGIGTVSPSTQLEVNGAITASGGNSTNWNTAYNWGNHATQGYLTSEVDPQVGTISSNRVPKWNGSALVTGAIYDNGNIGIGVTSPLEKLHVQDNGYLQAIFQSNNDAAGIALKSSAGQQYEMQSLNNGKFIIYDRNVGRYGITIDSIGRVGIGTQSPVTNLTVPGLGSTSSYNNLRYDSASGAIYYYSSSEKYKDDIQPLEEDFHKILKAQPKSFIDKVSGERNVGYIAEEFEELGLNNLVVYRDGQPDALKYELVSLYLLEVVKEYTVTMEQLKAENESLKKQLKEQSRSIEERLEAMEKMIKQNQLAKVM